MTAPNNGPPGPLPPFRAWQPSRPPGRSRLRRLAFTVGAVVLIIALGLVVALTHRRNPRKRPAGPAAGPEAQVPAELDRTELAVTVRSGEVIPIVLGRAGLPDTLIARALAAFEVAEFGFRHMRPGDSVTVRYLPPDRWQVLYRAGPERIWRVDLGPTDRVGMLRPRVELVPAVITGGITSSLWDALIQQGERPALVLAYADILGWEVDFFTETQAGDSFLIKVNRRMQDTLIIGYGPPAAIRYAGAVGDIAGFRYTDPDGRTDYYNPDGQCLRKTFLKSPLNFARVTSFFGRRFHPIHRTWRQHHGLDYAAPTGTPVSALAAGRVVRAGWHGGYGNCVDISHPGGYLTRYGHLSRFGRGVRVGTTVSQGQVIGYVGSTGVSTGPHLHFELHRNGAPINPLRFDPPRVEPVGPEYMAAFAARRDSLYQAVPGLRPRR